MNAPATIAGAIPLQAGPALQTIGMTKVFGGLIAVNDVDLMIIPAAAVDRTGMRMGWGRGYFDKTIGSMENCPPVYAVIFDSEPPSPSA